MSEITKDELATAPEGDYVIVGETFPAQDIYDVMTDTWAKNVVPVQIAKVMKPRQHAPVLGSVKTRADGMWVYTTLIAPD